MLELSGLRRLHVGPVDLRIESGECVSVQGRSGSGKTVLLRAVADLDPHEGDCALDGAGCSAMPAPTWRKRVTYVPADSGWWADRIRDHFGDPVQARSLFPAAGLSPEAIDWPVSRLSTGERQRVALLRALTLEGRALLLDEPTSGLDLETRERIESLLQARMARGCSILLVTHDPELARRIASRSFRMEAGQLRPLEP
ncbi:ABC transporter ATP-binding protein [Ramlibacter humi]|uniref:ATP-binding cassette domain-containing protein n=1 Tax=Ramlibacter humi TaxID=2530451 RepID=A0A4Z0BFJ5_9BURK|nr:ABC transporter ATP-binding protein [Ramlibacter humi]TFY96638.1 ATP-binding cassette domain-containing protein [Ramlibacter humi]